MKYLLTILLLLTLLTSTSIEAGSGSYTRAEGALACMVMSGVAYVEAQDGDDYLYVIADEKFIRGLTDAFETFLEDFIIDYGNGEPIVDPQSDEALAVRNALEQLQSIGRSLAGTFDEFARHSR